MLEGIGRIGNYLQIKNLKTSAKHKIQTGETLTFSSVKDRLNQSLQQSVNKANEAKKSGTSYTDAMKTASIKQKLKNGEKLSSQEMRYLKENNPSLYRKAKKAEEAREELEHELKHAKTKSQARAALMRCQMKAASEAMAELAAAKAGQSAGGGGAGGGGGDLTGNVSDASVMSDAGGQTDVAADIGTMTDMPAVDATTGATDVATSGNDVGAGTENVEGESTAEAQAIVAEIMHEINETVAEANEAAGQENEQSSDSTDSAQSSDGESTNPLESGDSSSFESDILEELLYKLKALQRVWEDFIHSKEYKEMPEDEISDEDDKGGKGIKRVSKNNDEGAIMDKILSYTNALPDAGTESSVDISY